jgi:hypothetical protein
MPITITQTADMPDGAAKLVATTVPVGAEMRITRLDMGAPRYLDPRQTGAAAWGAADVWFRTETSGDGAMIMGPEVTWHLKPHMPYAVSFRGVDGIVVEDRMVWKALRLPSTAPPPSRAGGVDLKRTPEAEPVAPLEDDLAAFAQSPDVAPIAPPVGPTPDARSRQTGEGKAKIWIIALVLLLMIAAVGYYTAFVNPGFLKDEAVEVVSEDPAEPIAEVEAKEPKPITLAWAREFLQSNPDAAAAAVEAQRFAAAGEESPAFLINRYAARQGNAAAAVKLGDMYAPETWKAGVIKAADPAQALNYYEQAGAKGDVSALEKAIALVESGQAPVADKAATLTRLTDALAKAKENQ